jgi:Flp pilus assembly protein TadD
MLGHIHAASGQVAAAEAVLARARALAPPDAVFLTDLGAAYSLAGVDQAARAAFQAALSIEDEFPRALCGLGDIEYRQGRWDLAKALFERAPCLFDRCAH